MYTESSVLSTAETNVNLESIFISLRENKGVRKGR
jgi:hypothetical protein